MYAAITGWEYGFLGAAVVAMATGIYQVTRYVLRRLFNEKDGIVTDFFKEHISTMKDMQITNADMAQSNKEIAKNTGATALIVKENQEIVKFTNEVIQELLDQHKDPDAPFSTTKTNAALKVVMDAIAQIATAMDVDVSKLHAGLVKLLQSEKSTL